MNNSLKRITVLYNIHLFIQNMYLLAFIILYLFVNVKGLIISNSWHKLMFWKLVVGSLLSKRSNKNWILLSYYSLHQHETIFTCIHLFNIQFLFH